MTYFVDHSTTCAACPFGGCIEDRRDNPIKGRSTLFRLRQQTAMNCTFEDFCPASETDPDISRSFDDYLGQFRSNAIGAGSELFGLSANVSAPAFAKVEGDVFELIEAAALWNAFAAWNTFMETSIWQSKIFSEPPHSIPTVTRRATAVKLPRGYDTTKLFKPEVRKEILAFEASMKGRGMELGLSSPDIVGVRLPFPLPADLQVFSQPINSFNPVSLLHLEKGYQRLEGLLDGRSFLFAIAVKRTTRSDRLYQPLFEANILKFIIEVVLRGAAFKFFVHMGSLEGANVEKHYKAASLISLMRGGEPDKAVNEMYHAVNPRDTAQSVLDKITLFPL